MLSWRARRQLIVLLIVAIPIALAGFKLVSKAIPEASCTDNRKNQGELAVDCGGPCGPCELKNPKPLTLYWARVVPVRTGLYDIAAQIENTNEVLSSTGLEYEFTLYDGTVPIAVRRGAAFIFPQERLHIIEANIETAREPSSVELKIINGNWIFRQDAKPNFVVERRDYLVEQDNGRRKSVVEATVVNKTPFDFKKIEVQAILLDKDENLLGAKRVLIENFLAGAREKVRISWPNELAGGVASVIVEPRVNVFDPSVILRPQ